MKPIHILSTGFLIVTALTLACYGADQAIFKTQSNNLEFAYFLNNKMSVYANWLRTTGNDPSPPIPDVVLLRGSGNPTLTCEISNQIMTGHAGGNNWSVSSMGNFTGHYFYTTRSQRTSYRFQGELNCHGVINATGFVDVEQDIPFRGIGNWTITTNSSVERIQVNNFGITLDKRFNLTHSWIDYNFYPQLGRTIFDNVWINVETGAQMERHTDKILGAFRSLYHEFLNRTNYDASNDFNPSKHLLKSYLVDFVINNTVIDDVLPVDPPPPYIPTPSIPTTTTTTTTTTSTPPTTPTSSTRKDDTTESSTRGSGTNLISSAVLAYFAVISALLINLNFSGVYGQ